VLGEGEGRRDAVQCGAVRCSAVQCGAVWCSVRVLCGALRGCKRLIRSGAVLLAEVRCDAGRYGMVRGDN
jgi:hypothetical protein